LQPDPILIECHASTRALTLYPERQIIDMKYCVPDLYYQDNVLLWNKHKISRKFWVSAGEFASHVRGESKVITIPSIGSIEVSPSVGFIQPNASCLVWVKVKFLKDAIESLQDTDGQFLTTIQFGYIEQATGKERYAPLTIKASVTTCDIIVKSETGSPGLRFEKLSVYEKKHMDLSIYNSSKFPQLIQYTDSPVFKIQALADDAAPNVFKIAPQSLVTRTVCFSPLDSVFYNETIKLKTTWNQELAVKCVGQGYQPPAFFDHPFIAFRSIPYGNDAVKRIALGRKSAAKNEFDLWFEFQQPILLAIQNQAAENASAGQADEELTDIRLTESDYEMLRIWPQSGSFGSQEEVGIEVVANILSKDSLLSPAKAAAPSVPQKAEPEAPVVPASTNAKSSGQGKQKKERTVSGPSKTVPDSLPAAPAPLAVPQPEEKPTLTPFQERLFSLAKPAVSWLVPCVLRPMQTEQQRLQHLISGEGNFQPSTDEAATIYLKVVVPIMDSRLTLVSPESLGCDFKAVPLGRKVFQTIVVKNTYAHPIKVAVEGLSPVGPFSIPRPIRPIPPGESASVQVLFKPFQEGFFSSLLELGSGTSRVKVRVSGEGILPKVAVKTGEELLLGDVCVGDSVSKEIEIVNTAAVGVFCRFTLLGTDERYRSLCGSPNYSGGNPFSISNYRAFLEPDVSLKLVVQFAPTREHDNFFDYLAIHYDGQTTPTLVKVSGKGWETSACVLDAETQPYSFKAPSFAYPQRKEYDRVGQTLLPKTLASAKSGKEESIVSEIFAASSKLFAHFVTVSLSWKQFRGADLLASYPALDENGQYWRIVSRDIILANLKPLMKLEKKAPLLDFTIEALDSSFEYDETLHQYVFVPRPASTNAGLSIALEPAKGTIEMGTTKAIRVDVQDPTRQVLHQCYQTWDRVDSIPVATIPTRFQKNTSPF
ncbi:hypothetical protein HDU91_000611, partial [Kappamyces sp. JEL0680]